jgi:hypothetical protein
MPAKPLDDQREKRRYRDEPWWKTLAEMIGIAAVVAYTIFPDFRCTMQVSNVMPLMRH